MFNLTNEKRIVILSAEQADKSDAQNANATEWLRHQLTAELAAGRVDSVVKCSGQYKGTPERSYLVLCNADAVEWLVACGAAFEQECILVVRTLPATGRTVGALYFPNGSRERIGTLALCEQGREYDASTTISGTDIAFHFA